MTNPKIRKSNKKSTAVVNVQHQQNEDGTVLVNALNDSGDGVELNLDDYSIEPTSNSEDVEEEEDEANSCSSFSLQECINEFRARRIRRLSTQSREVAQTEELASGFATERCEKKALPDPADADLISQNRSNKEQERKCKPCRNGFCYCFTSDSGEGGGVCAAAGTRAEHVRQLRRHRRSECNELSTVLPKTYVNPADHRDVRRESLSGNFKIPAEPMTQASPQKHKQDKIKRKTTTEATTNANELTAISRLETSAADAPLIHIIQELHNNCVISEVRVNKHKLQTNSQTVENSNVGQAFKLSPQKQTKPHSTRLVHEPTAPPLESFTLAKKQAQSKRDTFHGPVLDKISELDSLSDAFTFSTPLTSSSKHTDSGRRRHKAGGRLLQKRLSLSSVHSKPRRSLQAPPKPPRSYMCVEETSAVSSLSSTSPSLREAERILDEFLIRKGAMVREAEKKAAKGAEKVNKAAQVDMKKMVYATERRREQRKSCPSSFTAEKSRRQHILPSCPSLSDLERSAVDSNKKYSNYEKNIRQIAEKPVKELSFGWKEPKITDMLNCNTTTKERQFRSQAVQAEPQQAVGWQIPPKVNLDTVDGVCSNLAANISTKSTPVKSTPMSTPKNTRESQKFIWSEQWRNISPWCNKQTKSGDRALKSNLKSSSRTLLSSSKKKILRLVTPKRDNIQRRRNYSSHSIGIQTSQDELQPYEPSMTPQSPPGSYHSAVQTSTQTTTPSCSQNTNETEPRNFDFSRTVHPPPKKAPRAASQRKLNFPLRGCAESSCLSCEQGTLSTSMKTKTYRSYHGDLDQDVTMSKLGYILGNIRAKLEASDDHAVRTFQEIERREQRAAGFDCTDGHILRRQMRVGVERSEQSANQQEPIYSEIEEDSIHITGTPHYDNKTSAKEIVTSRPDVEVLYAKVNKANKKLKPQAMHTTPMPLGKLLHDSLKNSDISPFTVQLPTLQEQSGSDTSYMSPPQAHVCATATSTTLSHCRSLNNVRMQEQHSPPKRDRNLNKSDLSLHRSEIFLDNLCRSELVPENGELERVEKMNNNDLNKSYGSLRTDSMGQINTYRHFSTSTPTPNDSISYDTPNDADFDNISQADISQSGLSLANESMTSGAPNTPKKQNAPKFVTKSHLSKQRLSNLNPSTDIFSSPSSCHQPSTSCPATPRKAQSDYPTDLPHTSSLNEVHQADTGDQFQQEQLSTPSGSFNGQVQRSTIGHSCIKTPSSNLNIPSYKRLKNVLRNSFKRSTNFVKNETRRLSSSFSFPSSHISLSKSINTHNQTDPNLHAATSTYDLDALFALDEKAPVTQQLAQAVTICRQLPEVEISPEMVEAERLLLFSRLRGDVWPQHGRLISARACGQHTHRFYVDSMRLPIKVDVNQDFFFNYFYIVTFECGGVIKSTQSAECHNGQAIFSDCGIEFVGGLGKEDSEVRCKIFMLRLRKVSTLSLEPKRPIVKIPALRTPGGSSTSSSGDEIVSRFRLHASFSLHARNFVPYEYVECESKNTDKLCLRASAKNCQLPLTPCTQSTNLSAAIQISGRTEVRLPKHTHSGFLNVQDPHTLHNWNRRWCTLDGIFVHVWTDENQMDEKLLLSLDMRSNVQSTPLQMAPRELCARARAFCLQCSLQKAGEEVDTAAVFFAADTQEELEVWLKQLNAVLEFIEKWLHAKSGDEEY
ncbi:PREDICTED: uncharacterized protein LOC108376957 [Rhagoletis zephyria]|uniref:uncharacterized protein LOC108376957 n=1 Tax=Rhagoletis zephyria TaxID=28612 RepID=UPI000811A776|nr:PREDICTED: uncharacterized protein LOC108376957 [Rhagoletis zephyria]